MRQSYNNNIDKYLPILYSLIFCLFQWGIYAHPIFSSEGGFPKEFSERVAERSAQQGYTRSRLPAFTEEERAFVRGASDFFGVNHYTARMVSATEYKTLFPVPSLLDDMDVGHYAPDDWITAASSWLVVSNTLYSFFDLVSPFIGSSSCYCSYLMLLGIDGALFLIQFSPVNQHYLTFFSHRNFG